MLLQNDEGNHQDFPAKAFLFFFYKQSPVLGGTDPAVLAHASQTVGPAY